MNKLIAATGASLLLTGCAVDPGAPIEDASTKLKSYFEAKNEFAATLQKELSGGATGSNIYRLVSLNGPAYPIGSLISASNTLDLESRDCVVPESLLPDPVSWGGLPGWSSGTALDVGLGIPSLWQAAISGGETSLGGDVTMEKESTFQIEDLSQVFLAKDEIRDALEVPDCQDALQDLPDGDVIFVRGIVYGRETLVSANAFGVGLDLTLGDTGDFSFAFGKNGAFELREREILPKFAVITKLSLTEGRTADFRTGADDRAFNFALPSDDDVARIEARLAELGTED